MYQDEISKILTDEVGVYKIKDIEIFFIFY